eukprot:Nk52_evm23s367 gene=Nk52_evmTU23s367
MEVANLGVKGIVAAFVLAKALHQRRRDFVDFQISVKKLFMTVATAGGALSMILEMIQDGEDMSRYEMLIPNVVTALQDVDEFTKVLQSRFYREGDVCFCVARITGKAKTDQQRVDEHREYLKEAVSNLILLKEISELPVRRQKRTESMSADAAESEKEKKNGETTHGKEAKQPDVVEEEQGDEAEEEDELLLRLKLSPLSERGQKLVLELSNELRIQLLSGEFNDRKKPQSLISVPNEQTGYRRRRRKRRSKGKGSRCKNQNQSQSKTTAKEINTALRTAYRNKKRRHTDMEVKHYADRVKHAESVQFLIPHDLFQMRRTGLKPISRSLEPTGPMIESFESGQPEPQLLPLELPGDVSEEIPTDGEGECSLSDAELNDFFSRVVNEMCLPEAKRKTLLELDREGKWKIVKSYHTKNENDGSCPGDGYPHYSQTSAPLDNDVSNEVEVSSTEQQTAEPSDGAGSVCAREMWSCRIRRSFSEVIWELCTSCCRRGSADLDKVETTFEISCKVFSSLSDAELHQSDYQQIVSFREKIPAGWKISKSMDEQAGRMRDEGDSVLRQELAEGEYVYVSVLAEIPCYVYAFRMGSGGGGKVKKLYSPFEAHSTVRGMIVPQSNRIICVQGGSTREMIQLVGLTKPIESIAPDNPILSAWNDTLHDPEDVLSTTDFLCDLNELQGDVANQAFYQSYETRVGISNLLFEIDSEKDGMGCNDTEPVAIMRATSHCA